MAIRLKELPRKRFGEPGNAACPGCPETMGLRYLKMALGDDAVLVVPASCISVIQGLYPRSGIGFPILNTVFAAAASTAAGMSAGFRLRGMDDVKVVVYAGDGGTADIGLQAISGAAERNDDILYVCVDNEAYMNTGIQRSGATPYAAWTTTTVTGKTEQKKNVPLILITHGVPYVATASVGYPLDFIEKVKRAAKIRGFRYIHLLAPCPIGWRFDPSLTPRMAQLAVKTGFFPLYEYHMGKLTISPPSRPYRDPKRRTPIVEYLKLQGRYRHVLDNPEALKRIEEYINEQWKWLELLEKATNQGSL